MKINLHTHSTFCDGANTPKEIVLAAIDKGFSAIGFSSHIYTDFDLRYCMKNTEAYINEINQLKENYSNKIEIYLGIEEDSFSVCDRNRFDYIIGSSHYFFKNGKAYPIDSSYDYFKKCLEAFNYDIIALSNAYYSNFCNYIKKRKPDIIGHFDLITKFDEMDASLFLSNREYIKLSEKYLLEAIKSNCIFEVNTGAVSRGFRTFPYPYENLLYLLNKEDGKLILSSDSHSIETLDFGFDDTIKLLKDIGFKYTYTLKNNRFIKEYF